MRLFIALLTLLALLTAPSAVFAKHQKHQHSRKHEDKYGIPNFRKVDTYLYRGGKPSAAGFSHLADLGVKTVVDLSSDGKKIKEEQDICNRLGMRHVSISLSHRTYPTTEQIDHFLHILSQARDHKEKAPVFVHCQRGDDRTGCMIGIARIALDHYSFDQAYKEMIQCGFRSHFDTLTDAVRQFSQTEAQRQAMNKERSVD